MTSSMPPTSFRTKPLHIRNLSCLPPDWSGEFRTHKYTRNRHILILFSLSLSSFFFKELSIISYNKKKFFFKIYIYVYITRKSIQERRIFIKNSPCSCPSSIKDVNQNSKTNYKIVQDEQNNKHTYGIWKESFFYYPWKKVITI